jgi:uncharacterized radical SAM superfamily protein
MECLPIGLEEKGRAFNVRLTNFGNVIHFHAPGLKRYETEEFYQETPQGFIAMSLTGSKCALMCDHCKSKVLHSMRRIPLGKDLYQMAEDLFKAGTRSILISGGCDAEGRVPHLKYIDQVARIKSELPLRVIVHSGLVDEELAQALKEAGVDGAMIDIIGANETIHKVYHLKRRSVEDYERSLELLVRHGLSVIPHIVIGLHYGKILGEYRALEMIRRHQISALILVILMPILSTPMFAALPPSLGEIADIFYRARLAFPKTPVHLGCARPMGELMQQTDTLAVDLGLNGIAYPAPGIVAYAREQGLVPEFHETCCSIYE